MITPKQRFVELKSKKLNSGLTEDELVEFNVLEDALAMDEVIKYCSK